MEGDLVYLRISPMKGVTRFNKKNKLIPRYMGTYKFVKRVTNVPYELKLPIELARVHRVFYLSMLKKCIGDLVFIVPLKCLEVDSYLSYEEVPIKISYRQGKKLRNKEVASIMFFGRIILWKILLGRPRLR